MTSREYGANRTRGDLADRLMTATVGSLELFSVYLGWRLGLYRALRGNPLTVGELSTRTGVDERYAREWLEQQAVAGFLDIDDATMRESGRRFALPAEYAAVLADADESTFVAPLAPMLVGIAGALPDVLEAYRSGEGVPYARYGPDFRDGQGSINRPVYLHELPSWIAALPDIDLRLRSDPPAKIADIGCGQGFSTLALARAYPNAVVSGFDIDESSIADAIRLANENEVHVSYQVAEATDLPPSGSYDLICIFEALHDMAHPVEVLTAAHHALAPDGRVLVIDERVADRFTAPGDLTERMMYGWSVTHCLPASRVEEDSAALGTVLRADTVRELAAEAGLTNVEIPPIGNDSFRCYLLWP